MKVKYKQLYSNDCGISSIKNLLFINKIKVKEINIKYSENGISCYQIKKYLKKHFKDVEVVSFDINQIKNINNFTPFIYVLQKDNNSHYVVIYKKSKKYLYILDSLCNYSYKITYKNFEKIDGKIAIIAENCIDIKLKINNNPLIFLISFLSFFETLFTLSTTILLQQIIDNGKSDAIIFIIVQLLILLISKYKIKVYLKLYKYFDRFLVLNTLTKIYNLKYRYVKSHSIDELYYRINDAYIYKDMMLSYVFNFINDLILLILGFVLVFIYSKIIFIILLILFAIIFMYSYFIFKKNMFLIEEKRKEEYTFLNIYKDSFIDYIDIFKNKNKSHEEKSKLQLLKLFDASYRYEKLNINKNYNLAFFQSIIICILVGLYFTSFYKYLSVGSLIALINIVSLCLQPMLNLSSLITQFSNINHIKNRLNDINDNT